MELTLGTQVRGRACNFAMPVRGYVEKINEKTAVVRVENTSDCDSEKAKVKNNLVIVKLKDITVFHGGKWIKPGKIKRTKPVKKKIQQDIPGVKVKFTDCDGKSTVYANARLCGEAIGRSTDTIYNTLRIGGAFPKRSELYGCKVERLKLARVYE
ncbi:hypothetical protein [Enterococcus sp. 2201sp1_2201st1_B8_2201SCRN_220225]|uniref:hypothetical protein n=1 Tax=unclassified Enterococcus TaxID=2608891 RepID=UPI0034A34C79